MLVFLFVSFPPSLRFIDLNLPEAPRLSRHGFYREIKGQIVFGFDRLRWLYTRGGLIRLFLLRLIPLAVFLLYRFDLFLCKRNKHAPVDIGLIIQIRFGIAVYLSNH